MSIEFLLGVGDGLGTVIIGSFVALVRSWNFGYLREYLDSHVGGNEPCEDEQDRFEDLVERVDNMEERIESIDSRVKDNEM